MLQGFKKKKKKEGKKTHAYTQPSVAQNTVSRPYLQASCNNCQIQFNDKKNPFNDEKILYKSKYCFSLTIHKKLLNLLLFQIYLMLIFKDELPPLPNITVLYL